MGFRYNALSGFFDITTGSGGGGGGGPGYNVFLYTLTPTDISNKYITLPAVPATTGLTQLTVIGGPLQSYGTDFIVSGMQLNWSSLFLDGVLTSGDKLVVTYNS